MQSRHQFIHRRKFLRQSALISAGSAALISPSILHAAASIAPITVGDIMDRFIQQIPTAPFPETVDTLKAGEKNIVVTGVVTTMFATMEVINKTIREKKNFIIAHEPTFYNHLDNTSQLEGDSVYQQKARLLREHNIAVWRNHDYIHSIHPDGVRLGLMKQLGWESKYNPADPSIVNIDPVPLSGLIWQIKDRLGISMVRFIGDPEQSCSRILLLPGAAGGARQIAAISEKKPDLAICGEVSEWETPEYVRDSRTSGKNLSLLVLGHADSEEPGSSFMANWISEKFPGLPVSHIPSGNPFDFA